MKISSKVLFYRELFRLVTVVVLFTAVASCQFSDDAKAPFENFIYRLSNSLEIPPSLLNEESSKDVDTVQLVRYPSLRDLSHAIPPANINLIEFFSLSSCDLQRHVGQRNSSLGGFMKPSQALLYEYEFIRLAELCLPSLEASSDLYKVLSKALQLKKEQLPLVKWNALFASEEMAELFSLGTHSLSLDSLKSKPSTLYGAFETLALFVGNKLDDSASIEDAYGVVFSSKRIGELRLSMQMVVQYLSRVDVFLEYRISNKPLCVNEKSNPKFDIVNTVFMKFYIGEIQPYIALLYQQEKILFEKIDRLVSSLEPTSAFQVFWNQVYTAEGSEWNRFDGAIKNHTKNWQALLRQCGRLPN
ncbi:MAG: hypothetical protein ACJAUP_000992 [Cellvibrionaceae bacterium]|jgi:hypothetical protein